MANALRAAWRSYRRRTGVVRELITLALGLFAGLVLLPLCIYAVGQVLFGPYVRSATDSTVTAGPLALWTDYLRGLADGSLAFWLVLLGPYVAYVIWRLVRATWRA